MSEQIREFFWLFSLIMVPFIAIVLSVVIGSEIYISLKVRKRLMRLLLIMALHAAMFFVAILLQRYINPESPVYLLLLYSQDRKSVV